MLTLLIGFMVIYPMGTFLLVAVMLGEEIPTEWRIRHLVFLMLWPICLTVWGLREAVRFLNKVIRRGW